MSTPETRTRPNVLITGTPGTGKTTLAQLLEQNLVGFRRIDIAKEVESHQFYTDDYDEQYQTNVLDEDKLLDYLQEWMDSNEGGIILDYHSSDFFPKRWFDLIVVLRCENTQVLYDRLAGRGYSKRKLDDNMQCEIFGTVAEETLDAYDEERVVQLASETSDQMADNVRVVTQLVHQASKQR